MQVEFIERYDISKLSPAEYNPRKLEEDKFIKLQDSIRKFGMVKPLIINGDNGILTAGHQRTRAMKAVGMKYAPVIKICGIKIQDEIKFNLFHNSIETNKSRAYIKNLSREKGYCIIKPEDIEVCKNENATVVKEIGHLIMKYGEWGSVIADTDGNVIVNSDYAVAAKQLRKKVICYVIDNKSKKEISDIMSIDFGEYNYEALGIKSYNQLYCQMTRLSKHSKKMNKSSTYEKYLLPLIKKSDRILDFGAGKCAYVNLLRSKGYKIFAYEPNFQNEKNNLEIKTVVQQIKAIEKDVAENGLYDYVILDSVFNSVINNEIENYVAAVCCAFLKKDGKFITGTRNLLSVTERAKFTKSNGNRRYLEFLDKNNYSATFRGGVWTMQHFHTLETLKKLLEQYYCDVNVFQDKKSQSNIYAVCQKPKSLDVEYLAKALEFELNMEYPNNYKHNKHTRLQALIIKQNLKANRLKMRRNVRIL